MKTLCFDAPAQDTLRIREGEFSGGETFTVEESRALELLTDPHLRVYETHDERALTSRTREELNEMAEAAGVEDSDELPNKDAVIEAIEDSEDITTA